MPLRNAFRRWLRRPGVAAVTVLVLSLGVGATTAMFSIVDAVLLQDEPWPAADRLVRIYGVLPQSRANPAAAATWDRGGIAWASWRELQAQSQFEDVVAWVPGDQIIGDERTELVHGFYASSTLPQMVGARPLHGRLFTAAEDEADSGAVIISQSLWLRLFGGDPAVIGALTTVTPPGASAASKTYRRTIVGILPDGFVFPGRTPDVLIPLGFHKYNGSFGTPFFHALGRLAPDASPGAAAAAAEPFVRRDESRDRRTVRVVTLRDERIGFGERPLWLMLAAAALLLVAACANVVGVLLSDGRSRRRETAVRLALGATRLAIVRQLMVEHAVLAIAAAAGGVMLAHWFLPSLVALAPPGLVGAQSVSLDRDVALAAVALAVATAMIAGLIPAIAITAAAAPGDALKTGAREIAPGARWRHRAIVATQFGLALVLLVGAGLFGETLIRLGREPLGFSTDGVAVVAVARDRAAPQPYTPEQRQELLQLRRLDTDRFQRLVQQTTWVPIQSLLDRLAALPGVRAAAVADAVPFTRALPRAARVRAGHEPPEQAETVLVHSVSSDYFAAMGIRILRGTTFDTSVGPGGPVVISDSVARRHFEGDPVGRKLALDKQIVEVAGVVADVKQSGLLDDRSAAIYFPVVLAQSVRNVVVRATGDIAPRLPEIREAIERHDRPMFVSSIATMRMLVDGTTAVERSRALFSGLYGAAALLLATVGLYGLAARLVAERRREIGVRVALGAGRRDVRRLVMSDAWLIVAGGLLIGLPAAIGVSRAAQGMLYGVSPAAPHVLAIAAAALGLAAVSATAVPVWRANRVDPAHVLRDE